jgi:dTDP-4-dehydrorhamnose reductase
MRIAVTGASGLLGLNLCLMAYPDHEVHGFVNSHTLKDVPFPTVKCDLLDWRETRKNLDEIQPDWLIHCAALASVDDCERNPAEARKINAEVPAKLSAYCAEKKIGLIHISTDAVFDGKMGGYVEEDKTNPLSVYAVTKLEAENQVLSVNQRAMVLRVNFYGFSLSGDHSLAEFFLNNLSAENQVNGFVDVMFCPMYVRDLVDIIFQMMEKKLIGLYHIVSSECLSKYAFGVRIAEKFGLEKDLIQPISVHESGLTAKRSPRLTLKVDKLTKEKVIPPDQEKGIKRLFLDFQAGLPQKIRSFAE